MFGTSSAITESTTKNVMVAGNIAITDKVSLSIILDKCLTFKGQVKSTCKAIH